MGVLTVSAVVASVGGVLSSITSGAIAVFKMTASIAFAVIFAVAIATLVGSIEAVVFGSIVGEVLKLLSIALPFNAGAVFGAINIVIIGIFSFLISRKIYMLVSNLISVSGH